MSLDPVDDIAAIVWKVRRTATAQRFWIGLALGLGVGVWIGFAP